MFEAFWAMFDAAWGLKKSPWISSSVLGNLFKWTSYSWLTLSFLLDLCHAFLFIGGVFFEMHQWFSNVAQELPSFIDVQDCDEKARGWLSSCCQFDWRASFHLSLTHHCENENQQIHKHFGKCCLYSSFLFCKRRTVPSTFHGIVGTNTVISVRCFGKPLWEAQSKFNTWTIIILLIMFGNILG